MNLEQYAAQHQNTQQEQNTQEAEYLTAGQLAARMDAERLSSLMAEAQAALDDQQQPAEILTRLYNALFGPNSEQAAELAAILDRASAPGGHEIAIAQARQRRTLLKRQSKQLEEMQKEINQALTALEESERELINEKARAANLDAALTEAATFAEQIDGEAPEKVVTRAKALLDQHRRSLPAMGLLYGTISDTLAESALTGRYDLYQREKLSEIRRQLFDILG